MPRLVDVKTRAVLPELGEVVDRLIATEREMRAEAERADREAERAGKEAERAARAERKVARLEAQIAALKRRR